MTRYQNIAANRVANWLKCKGDDPITLFAVSCIADDAAAEAGKKMELYPSLYDYAALLPGDWKTAWLSASDSPTADSMLYAVPRDWKSRDSNSEEILLGRGALRYASR